MNQRILALLLCSPLSSIACSGARVAVESPVTSGAHGTDAVDVASPDATTPADGAADDASTRRPWDGAALAHDAAVRRAVASCRAGDGEVAIALEREVIEAECEDEFRHCRVSLGIRVTNCASRPVALRGVHVTSPGGRRAEWSVELVAIAPGASDTTRVRLDDEREEAHQLEASAIDDSGERAWRWSGSFRVANPARQRATAACEACRGVWGRWGITQREGCNCRTRDAGRACEDGRDCEGLCMATGTRVVTAAVAPRCECPAGCRCSGRPRRRPNGTIEGMCAEVCTAAQQATVVAVGACSEFRSNFGCHSYIPNGARDEGPRPAGMRVSSRCAD